MIWRYYFPHIWEQPRTCWEDVWLRPDNPAFHGLAYFITVESFGYLAAQDDPETLEELERLRDDSDKRLWVRSYDGSKERLEVKVRAEDFSWEELVEWTCLFLRNQGEQVDGLAVMADADVERLSRVVYRTSREDPNKHNRIRSEL